MAELALYKREEIAECRKLVEAAINSQAYQDWLVRAYEDIDFYEGRQAKQEDLDMFKKLGMSFEVTNLIAMRLDALAGKEVATRTRFKFKSRSGKPQEAKQADGISALALQVQENNKSSRVLSQAKHYARICGLGWHGFDVVGNRIVEAAENPLDVIWDSRDMTPLMANQGFVARVKWMTVDEAQTAFPQRKEQLAMAGTFDAFSSNLFGFSSTVNIRGAQNWRLFGSNGYWDEKEQLVGIVEVQKREPAKYYRATGDDGSVFVTFDYEEAKKVAVNKKAIVEQDGYKVCVGYYCGQIDLEYMESPYQLDPTRGDFLLTPVVHARQITDGVPYGLVDRAKGPQRNYNVKSNKRRWFMVSRGILADKMAFDNPQVAQEEINRPDYFILKNAGKDVQIENHSQRIAEIAQDLAIHKSEIEAVMGIYDEALGVETNAQSGVAIARRQTASSSTTLFAIDGYNQAQKEVAEKMLWLIRNIYTGPIALSIIDDEELVKSLGLKDGKPLKMNYEEGNKRMMDVRMGEYDVVVEQIPDADTMNDLAREGMMQLVQSNIPPEKWTPGLMDIYQIPKSASLRKEIEEGIQKRLQQGDEAQAQLQKMIGGRAQPQTPMPSGGVPALQTQLN